MAKWYGQFLQDKYVWNTFFKGTTTGVFLDVGASDGCRFSNTKAFEDMGWTGLCVEARTSAAEQCRQCRPKSYVENVAISCDKDRVQFLEIEGYGEGLSGVVDEYDPRHVSRINQELRHPDCKSPIPKSYTIDAVPLQQLLDKYKLTVINYFSLDVEGSELSVLKSIDWDKVLIEVIDVEVNYDAKPITDFLTRRGYKVHSRIECDMIFVLDGNDAVTEESVWAACKAAGFRSLRFARWQSWSGFTTALGLGHPYNEFDRVIFHIGNKTDKPTTILDAMCLESAYFGRPIKITNLYLPNQITVEEIVQQIKEAVATHLPGVSKDEQIVIESVVIDSKSDTLVIKAYYKWTSE